MSNTRNASNGVSSSTFLSVFDAASKEYKKKTGQDLHAHPFAAELNSCDSPDAVLGVFQKQADVLDGIRKGDEGLVKWLNPIVHILYLFSGTLGEGVGLTFSPAKTIFTGIGVLLTVAKDVTASYEVLADLFERIESFLSRLKIYSGVPLTAEMTKMLGKIMAEVLCILSLATKEMKQRRIKSLMKRLVGRTDVEDALQRLDKLTLEELRMVVAKNLEVAYGVDGNVKAIKTATGSVDKKVEAIQWATQGVSDNVKVVKEVTYTVKEVTEAISRNQSRADLRRWLSPPDPSTNHNIARDAHHDGTAGWFTRGDTYKQWKTAGPLLWIHGKPGSGKSILCSTIIQEIEYLRGNGEALMAYFYFDFKDIGKQDARSLLSSILTRLCEQSNHCWNILSHLYFTHLNGSQQPSEGTLAQCLKEMLNTPGQPVTYIIVDALDECPNTTGTPSARERVLNLIEDLVNLRYPNLRICITSRPEQDIRTVLEPLTPCRFSLHDECGQKEDIVSYVRAFVQSDRAMRRWREEDKELVIKTLSEKADGMFRWVFCQLDTLRRCIPASIRLALDELPVTLDETYERTLVGIPEEKWEHAHRLFQCLIGSVRPLRVDELAEIFAIQFDQGESCKLLAGWRPEDAEDAVLSACSSLIAVVESEDSRVVQFSHFSVKEFLISNRLAIRGVKNASRYHIPLEPAHTILARACLTILLNLDDQVDKDGLKNFPLAFYAAENWVDHARFGKVSARTQDSIEHLFDKSKPHFKVWVWIHDIEKRRNRSTSNLETHPSQPTATPLYCAALCGLPGLAERLIAMHPQDVQASCGFYGTPLHAASSKGYVDVARLLIQCGAEVNAKNEYGKTPLHVGSKEGGVEIVQLLLDHGADTNSRDSEGDEPLDGAFIDGKIEVTHLLVRSGADVKSLCSHGWTPLHMATEVDDLEVVKMILERGADINAVTRNEETALHLAVKGTPRVAIARYLLEQGADVHVILEGKTLLQIASANGHKEITQSLLEHGAKEE